jgi:hypothetical protein
MGAARFAGQVGVAVLLAALVLAYPLHAYGTRSLAWSVAAGCALCVGNAIAGCAAIAWAVRRDRRHFLPTVFGSMGIRMALIGAAVVVMVKTTGVHVAGFIGSLFGFFVVFQTLEVIYLARRLPASRETKQEA